MASKKEIVLTPEERDYGVELDQQGRRLLRDIQYGNTKHIPNDVDLKILEARVNEYLDNFIHLFIHSDSRMSFTLPEWMTKYMKK
jgi:hypothetical protein